MPRTIDDIKKDCERHFQAGGGKVQVFDANGLRTASAPVSAAAALRMAFPGEQVFARRKQRATGSYAWELIGIGK